MPPQARPAQSFPVFALTVASLMEGTYACFAFAIAVFSV